jgi:hypothetical protein
VVEYFSVGWETDKLERNIFAAETMLTKDTKGIEQNGKM